MSLLDRVVFALFGGSSDKAGVADRELIDELIEMLVEAVKPRVRLRAGYRAKLAEGTRITVAHLRELGRSRSLPSSSAVPRGPWIRTSVPFSATRPMSRTASRAATTCAASSRTS